MAEKIVTKLLQVERLVEQGMTRFEAIREVQADRKAAGASLRRSTHKPGS